MGCFIATEIVKDIILARVWWCWPGLPLERPLYTLAA
jgi:hypothetical protein